MSTLPSVRLPDSHDENFPANDSQDREWVQHESSGVRRINTPRPQALLSLLPALCLILHTIPLKANPAGGTVQAGDITISDVAGLTTITQSGMRGIIHWQDFSIGALETTRFIQPSSSAATLNRVTGGLPSNLHGTLEANGNVFLLNPNGVLVGPNGRVNTAGFAASSLDVPDGEFLNGNDLNFSGPSLAGVVNLGIITASEGDVVLMARTVRNEGSISSPNGTAALAAGNEILLKASGSDRVVVKSAVSGDGDGVTNSGVIEGAQAELKAAGGNVYALAVNNSGIVRATGISKTKNGRVRLSAGGGGGAVVNTGRVIAKNSDGGGGRVELDGGPGGSVRNEGAIDASASEAGQPGGTVEILGDNITIGNGSVIDVSGSDGGLVAIGISAEKADLATPAGGIATLAQEPGAQSAQQVTIQGDSSIFASATAAGNGGKIIVWSEERSILGGVIEARGGELGGNGGLIETSGRLGLSIGQGTKVNASAPLGMAGTWLLDPVGITVNLLGGLASPFTQTAATNAVAANDILVPLALGTNVTITTTGAFPGNSDILIDTDLLMSSFSHPIPATLTFQSAGGIIVNGQIGGLSVPIGLVMNAPSGDIEIATGSGGIFLNSITASAGGTITVDAPLTADGAINLSGVLGVTSSAGGALSATTSHLSAGSGAITMNGDMIIGSLTMNAEFGIGVNSLNNIINIIGDVNRGGAIVIRNGVPLTIDGIWGGGFTDNDVTVRTVGNIVLNPAGGAGHSGAQIIAGGAGNEILLEAAGPNGRFINNAGASAIDAAGLIGSGARFRAYSVDQNAPFSTGGLEPPGSPVALYTSNSVTFNEATPDSLAVDPLPGQNVFYFSNVGGGGGGGGGGGYRDRLSPISTGMPMISESEQLKLQLKERERLNELIVAPEYTPALEEDPWAEFKRVWKQVSDEHKAKYGEKPQELIDMENKLTAIPLALDSIKRQIQDQKDVLEEISFFNANLRKLWSDNIALWGKGLKLGITDNIDGRFTAFNNQRKTFLEAEARTGTIITMGKTVGLAEIYKRYDADMAELRTNELDSKTALKTINDLQVAYEAFEAMYADLKNKIANYPWPADKIIETPVTAPSGPIVTTTGKLTRFEFGGAVYFIDENGNYLLAK